MGSGHKRQINTNNLLKIALTGGMGS